MTLEQFIISLEGFDAMSASVKIDFFVYYLTVVKSLEGVSGKDVEACFEELKIKKYSNINQYLALNAKKQKTRQPKFILQKGLYHLERSRKLEIDIVAKAPPAVLPTDAYFPLELFENTRGYLQNIANQSAACYDKGLYDACSVMTRKLLEVLIIEAFEKYKISEKIKNTSDNFFYLSELIENFRIEVSWNVGRNAKAGLNVLKKMGDQSAHNRRYSVRKVELDKIRDDLRLVLEELLHLIDYPNWKN